MYARICSAQTNTQGSLLVKVFMSGEHARKLRRDEFLNEILLQTLHYDETFNFENLFDEIFLLKIM